MFEKALVLRLYSITSVHAGSGAELSVIADSERKTYWLSRDLGAELEGCFEENI